MKKLLLMTLLTLSFNSFATEGDCDRCAIKHGIPVNSELDMIAKISTNATEVLKKADEANIKKFVKRLCKAFDYSSRAGTNPKEIVQDRIMTFLNEPENFPSRAKLSQAFFTRYNNYLYCENTYRYESTKRPKQHLFKIFVDYRKDEDFLKDWFAVRGNKDRPNLNAVQRVKYPDGSVKDETLIDYMQHLIDSNNDDFEFGRLRRLIRKLERAGARRAEDLKCCHQ